ncbi:hypothetical protein IQ07DRAFT_14077 [Pyrenochaeta sp. DS3sAY3a]|nr:hypothetical protein IQ07DRAFT_14077 [Pyrenochaeta sp. DS3sAY3a]
MQHRAIRGCVIGSRVGTNTLTFMLAQLLSHAAVPPLRIEKQSKSTSIDQEVCYTTVASVVFSSTMSSFRYKRILPRGSPLG